MWHCAECGYINEDSRPICDGCLYKYDTFRITIRSSEAIDEFNDERECDIEHNIFRLRCNRLDYLVGLNRVNGENEMTPQEELFASFFSDEKVQIKDMSQLEMRARREELAKFAFEARARLTAIDDEERERKAKAKRGDKTLGFSTSLHTDELTTNAINKVRERGKKISKEEKTLEGLIKMGMDRKDAEKLMSAGTILARVRANEAKTGETPMTATPSKFVNPFVNTPEVQAKIDVAISEETATVVVTKTAEEPKSEPKATAFVNPFAK